MDVLVWLRDRISFRRIIILAGILLLTAAFAQAFSLDVAFMFAGDAMVYFELFAFVSMVVLRGHIRLVLEVSRQRLRQVRRRGAIKFRRGFRRQRLTRALRAFLPPKSDEEGIAFA
ncbi:MAG: hypothetical protein JWN16_525 [Alphaproteobacteria bacterium]|nr:hypothetical protein [Alphaproteobacteria bacterium]